MISREMVGKRLREVRQRQKMTLKDVEETCGLSSTHISEIERGMTSPTIGALIRIAYALRKDPSFFIEERELEEFCLTTEDDRIDPIAPAAAIERGQCSHLTRGILGGRIRASSVQLDPGGSVELRWIRRGQDVCFYCIDGSCEVQIGATRMAVGAGDSIHGCVLEPPSIATRDQGSCHVLVFCDSREEA
ncbi:MAG: helix-turn-helix domain-containing protein [Candidatus Eisenbacteria bacterium]|nr:XRE family transcriptional regulator [Candidatus Eisenbacteria bacterium]